MDFQVQLLLLLWKMERSAAERMYDFLPVDISNAKAYTMIMVWYVC